MKKLIDYSKKLSHYTFVMNNQSGQGQAKRDGSYIGTIEAASILNVTPPTVQRWIDEGAIPCYRTYGGHRRVLRTDVIQFLSRQNVGASPQIRDGAAKILIVDDDPNYLNLLKRLVKMQYGDVSIETTDSGLEALLIALGQWSPDLLILDLHMPKINGLDVIRRIRQDDRYAALAIIVLSGHPEGESEALGAGANAFFQKGEGPDKLVASLVRHLPSLTPRTALS